MVYKSFEIKFAATHTYKSSNHTGKRINSENQRLAEQLNMLIIRKFKKQKVYFSYKDNIWSGDLADMQLIGKYNKGLRFLLCIIDGFSKYTWVTSLKDQISITITNILQKNFRPPVNFAIDQWNGLYKIMTQKCVQ